MEFWWRPKKVYEYRNEDRLLLMIPKQILYTYIYDKIITLEKHSIDEKDHEKILHNEISGRK